MKEEPDSLSVPYNFARCFNDQCPQASKCLRHIAAQNNGADYLYITNVNPARYPADGITTEDEDTQQYNQRTQRGIDGTCQSRVQ